MSHSPHDPDELAGIVRDAAASGDGLAIVGGGSRAGFGLPVEGTPLHVGALQGITLYEPGALTLVARAGTPLATIDDALREAGQMLPFEPLELGPLYGRERGSGTIGGVVATNASGPRRIQCGACRDSLIGVEFVDGSGRRIKNGGRVMKNVTGYDLVKLLCGTHGTLGVLTDVSFKLLPAPEHAATVSLPDLPIEQAIAAMSTALGSPYQVSGAAHVPARDGAAATTSLRVDGLFQSVDYRARELVSLLQPFGAARIDEDRDSVARTWRALRDIETFAPQDGDTRDIWRISVKPTDGARVAAALAGSDLQFDWGGGLVWVRCDAGRDVRAELQGIDGHATLMRASVHTQRALGVFEPEAAAVAAISSGLRARFDPAGVLNPGRMGALPEPAVA